MEKISGIYRIINEITGKLYVGSAINIQQRWWQHRNDLLKNKGSILLQRAWNKYGPDVFLFEVLELCTPCDLIVKEQYWMDYYESHVPKNGYNVAPKAGSSLGIKRRPESIEKMRISKKKWLENPENRAKLNYWQNMTEIEKEETKTKIRTARTKQVITEETKCKMSLAQKGKSKLKAQQRTPEQNIIVSQNISKSKKGKKLKIDPAKKLLAQQKGWETRKANGSDKGYHHTKKRSIEAGQKLWESRRKNGTGTHSMETKRKLSEYNKKYRTGINHPRYGTIYPPTPHSPETIQKITLTKHHNAMNEKQINLYRAIFPKTYGELLNIVNY